MLRFVAAIPRMAVTALIVLAIVNLLIGVIFRYFVGALTYYLDLDPIPFTWVEEVGEMSLAWLTLIGAAIGVRQRSHFTLYVFAHHLPRRVQVWTSRAVLAQSHIRHSRLTNQSGVALRVRRHRRDAHRALRAVHDLRAVA